MSERWQEFELCRRPYDYQLRPLGYGHKETLWRLDSRSGERIQSAELDRLWLYMARVQCHMRRTEKYG